MSNARPDPLSHHLTSMAYNNGWANQRLLSVCAQLSQVEFEARRCSFFPSIKATLNHSLCVDWFYLDALERDQQDLTPHANCYRFFAVDEPFQSCAELWREQAQIDRRLIAYCAAQRDEQLERIVTIDRPGRPQRDSRTRLLAHLFQHQIHHRGQVHAMLAGSSQEGDGPPRPFLTPLGGGRRRASDWGRSVVPPQLDEFFCAGEADERAAEFAALGWTEALVWD